MDAVTRLLSDLVAIPSVNPMGRALTGPGFLEGGMSDYLEAWFRDARASTSSGRSVAPGRDNLIARYEAPGARRTILFDAHQDTVPVDGMTIDPFAPDVRGGPALRPGVLRHQGGDGGDARPPSPAWSASGPAGSASVVMACTVDEEFTHIGSSRLADGHHGADLAIVAEPTLLDLVDRHKGAVRWKVRTRGVACHTSTPAPGRERHLRDGPGRRGARGLRRRAGRIDARPGPRPAQPLGRADRGGDERQRRPRLVRDRDRPPGDPRRAGRATARAGSWRFLRERLGDLERVEFLPPWVNMPPLVPGPGRAVPARAPARRSSGSAAGRPR